jgi:hypothetical protein
MKIVLAVGLVALLAEFAALLWLVDGICNN